MITQKKKKPFNEFILDPSLDMEKLGMTGRSNNFEGIVRAAIPDPPSYYMGELLMTGASQKGMKIIENKTSEDFTFYKQIGEGAFSTVYLVKENSTRKNYAMKVVDKELVRRNKKIKMIVREKNVMALLTYVHGAHPLVVSLYCTFQDMDKLYFALSICERGDLLDMLKRVSSFDLTTTRFYSAEIIEGLSFIHQCGIVHRDLKPENVLIKEDGHISITDFGSAKILSDPNDEAAEEMAGQLNVETAEDRGERRATFVGTAQYVSPEMLKDDPVGIEADYWALGAMIYQMLSGSPPFRAVNDYHLLKKIQNLDFTFPPGFPESALELVKELLVLDPSKRLGHPDLPSIKDHPFYEGVDFATLSQTTPPDVHPYCPASFGEPEFYSEYVITPGLDKDAVKRLAMGHLADTLEKNKNPFKDESEISYPLEMMFARDAVISEGGIVASPSLREETKEERSARIRRQKLERQKDEHEYHQYAQGNLILRSGFVDKKKGLFARRRMFLLTDGPSIYYVDAETGVYKGQIPLCFETTTEVKNFRTFFVHTKDRTYYLFDPARRAPEWCEAIDKLRDRFFTTPTPRSEDEDIIEHRKVIPFLPFIRVKETRADRLRREHRQKEIKERHERTEAAKKAKAERERLAREEEKRKEVEDREKKRQDKEKEKREKALGRRS